MTYNNNLTQDLLYGLATNRDCASKETVSIWMVHALAKVRIILDESLGDIGQVTVSGYKTGHFSPINNGVPAWEIDNVNTHIYADFRKYEGKVDEELKNNNSVTVFILPDKITGLKMWNSVEQEIDASEEIKSIRF